MFEKLKNIFWFIFAWGLGSLFILGGISNFFDPMYESRKPMFGIDYNIFIGIGGVAIGVLIIRAWFKMYINKKH
ncbi:MAG: hypothetical protein P9L93_02005 [Candidatus Gorgyraea atricola]|nr:hypothetical protein [Candidatus Gorgyraea atricola]